MCVCFENALISLESVNIFFTTFAKNLLRNAGGQETRAERNGIIMISNCSFGLSANTAKCIQNI